MVPVKLDGVPVFAVVAADVVGVRVRVSLDEWDALGLRPGRQVRVEAPGRAGTYLLTAADQAPPFVFFRLLSLAPRAAAG